MWVLLRACWVLVPSITKCSWIFGTKYCQLFVSEPPVSLKDSIDVEVAIVVSVICIVLVAASVVAFIVYKKYSGYVTSFSFFIVLKKVPLIFSNIL